MLMLLLLSFHLYPRQLHDIVTHALDSSSSGSTRHSSPGTRRSAHHGLPLVPKLRVPLRRISISISECSHWSVNLFVPTHSGHRFQKFATVGQVLHGRL